MSLHVHLSNSESPELTDDQVRVLVAELAQLDRYRGKAGFEAHQIEAFANAVRPLVDLKRSDEFDAALAPLRKAAAKHDQKVLLSAFREAKEELLVEQLVIRAFKAPIGGAEMAELLGVQLVAQFARR